MSRAASTALAPAAHAEILDGARAAAGRAAGRAGIRIAMPHELEELGRAAAVWQRVWSPDGEPLVPGEMLRALTHAGNYLGAAYAGEELVGALMGFFGAGAHADRLHSHILGVDPHAAGHGVGHALKLHQRAWTLERGIERITWTYDPLVRRNGHFNLVKLGARGVEYLVDFYGPMPDAINGGEPTDRVLVDWDLMLPGIGVAATAVEDVDAWRARGAVVALDTDASGAPRPGDGFAADCDLLLCATPPDIVALRRADPACAREWRAALRTVMLDALQRGLQLVAMARGGWYVLARD